ncbi:Gldg family protein [Pleionea sp. CnH1-48]|uniref:Gldg family protein n=1 Tax=Pleionea sp. CnH1-48 TaxID=2954494 RepID=UPI0020986561|nr:Gldg family protein [Pleionea sp. CnH1-48]MCO7224460.1 Gldg family protein [Pleionea sp. CnH1-48]
MVKPMLSLRIKQLLTAPHFYFILALYIFIVSTFLNNFTYSYLSLQNANAQSLSISGFIFAPLNSLSLLLIFIIIPMLSAQTFVQDEQSGIQRLNRTLPLSAAKLWWIDWLALMLPMFILNGLLSALELGLLYNSHIDWPVFMAQILGHALSCITFLSITLAIMRFTRSQLGALIFGYSLLFALWLVQLVLSEWPNLSAWLTWLNLIGWYSHFRVGLLSAANLISPILLSALVIVVCFTLLQPKRKHYGWLFVFVLAALLIGSRQLSHHWDLTSNHRFSLIAPLTEHISDKTELSIDSYGLNSIAQNEVEQRLIHPLQQTLPDMQFTPHKSTMLWEDRQNTGLLIRYNKQELWIDYPFSSHPQMQLLDGLNTLKKRHQSVVMLVEGHDEASHNQKGQRHLSELAKILNTRGWTLVSASLSQLNSIPSNVELVVIASSRQPWFDQEEERLKEYLQTGGNLLWLRDPEDVAPQVLEQLPVTKIDGTLMDALGFQRGTPHPGVLLIESFSKDHEITANLTTLVALPWTSAFALRPTSEWQAQTLLNSHSQTWTELNTEATEVAFNEELGELRGRFPVMVELQRQQGPHTQRIVISGDSHFLANTAINNYANTQLAINLFNYLTAASDVTAPQKQPVDKTLTISPLVQHAIGWFFPFFLPVLLLLIGCRQWLIRKKS